ncbi:uncharacterized protein LOC132310308 [Cornus florida]|uniref:uncharacterized protein LOC132310308 n=1 Tax=Cornus florida TaxID=4283 RepID=UPI0028996B5E|nr:uncharacterized protein LOC132310308 [Cornus florida]
MRVVMEILTGKLFYIQVGDDATVGDLKREIGAQEKLPHDRLILILDDSNLHIHLLNQNELSLVDCGVQDGSHVYLFFDPLDDGSPSISTTTTSHFLLAANSSDSTLS